MEKEYGVCRIAVAPIRTEPTDKAEISSQLLFGESVLIVEKTASWWLIETSYDQYQGWIDFRHINACDAETFETLANCKVLSPQNYNATLTAADGSLYHLSAASNLPFYENGKCFVGNDVFDVNFQPHNPEETNFHEDILKTAKFFQNTPYLWGGRNIFGFDCSGFVQTVFKLLNVKMPRDAYQQAEKGQMVAFLSECKPGDVAFFDNTEGRITHVGIMISNNEIIHSSGKVRIDPIDDQGIFNKELNKYTHQLRIIKRYID
jgi:cell wall-associated NlpC family hydrolase